MIIARTCMGRTPWQLVYQQYSWNPNCETDSLSLTATPVTITSCNVLFMRVKSMKWVDVEDIACSLEDAYPNQDIFALRFTELKSMVVGLPEFDDDTDGCNEKILEAIQMAWSAERDE
ncbi:hypothetical protein AM299 [Anaplasma marginale str. St. Maries]|uniref:Fe-S assembly protein IscX n=2 Tax=Anaplasma marginale TaxID=770 RepID=B9KHY7_ANAMF|nr:hypothetical protein AM299 [Anaplasma marginale str. St. Maries]ACM49099.1 Conserved hypothetical protein [Anaplasma marginale str. Florida]